MGTFLSQSWRIDRRHALQAMGSCITYGRRYALAAIAGVAPEDDDGEAASRPSAAKPATVKPAGYDDWLTDMEAVAEGGTDALIDAWKASRAEFRDWSLTQNRAAWDRVKTAAAANKHGAPA